MQQYESLEDIRDDEIDLLEIMEIIFKRKVLVISITVIVSLVGIIAGLINYQQGKMASNIIGYNYDGISKGLNIDGTQFISKDIKNTVVSRKVYNKYPILKEKGIDFTEFVDSIKIEGITPDNISNLASRALKRGETFIYNPFDYIVSLKVTNNTKLDSEILTSLTDEYMKYFKNKYRVNEIASTINMDELNSYDYKYKANIIGTNIDTIKEMVKRSSEKDFVSRKTGLTYTDIIKMLENIETVDLDNIKLEIEISSMTSENGDLSFENKLKKLRLKKEKTMAKAEVLKEIIKDYKLGVGNIVLPESGETGIQISTGEEYYTKLLDDYTKTATSIKELEIAEQLMIKSKSNSREDNSIIKERIAKEIETIVKKYNKIVSTVNIMNEEYYNKNFADSVRVIAPTSVSSDSKAKIIVLAGIILGIMLGFGSAFLAELKDKYHENKSNRNQSKKIK